MCFGFFHHLCLRVLRTHTGRSQFDHLSELGDGLGWGLGGLGQFLLAGRGTSDQQLSVLHQRLGCLQDALPEGWRDTLYHNLLHGHTQVPAIWKEAVAFLTECVLSKERFKFGSSCEMNLKCTFDWVVRRKREICDKTQQPKSSYITLLLVKHLSSLVIRGFSSHIVSLLQGHCTCGQQKTPHSQGSVFQLRRTWWWCPGQRWCQKRRRPLWYRPGCLCSPPAALTAPRTPGT